MRYGTDKTIYKLDLLGETRLYNCYTIMTMAVIFAYFLFESVDCC